MFTGRLRVVSCGDFCNLHIEDATTGELFAKAPIEKDGSGCEAVTDSSRYFVIKVVDPSTGKHAFVGLGFQERSFAFDLNVAIQDHVKRVGFGNTNQSVVNPTQPSVDYSLKDGQNFTISFGGAPVASLKNQAAMTVQSDDLSKFMIPPPPSAGSSNSSSFSTPFPAASSNAPSSNGFVNSGWDDDFGAFASASTTTQKQPQQPQSQAKPSGWTTF